MQLFEDVYKPVQKVTGLLVYSAVSLPWASCLIFPPDSQSGLSSDRSSPDPYRASRRSPASSMHRKLKIREYEPQLISFKSKPEAFLMQGRALTFGNATEHNQPVKLQLTNAVPRALSLISEHHNHTRHHKELKKRQALCCLM